VVNTDQIRLVLFDVDGVLTDGTLFIGSDGEKCKSFNAKDGVAVALLKKHKIMVGVISGKTSKALDYRIRQLNFDFAITGCNDKLNALNEIMESSSLNPSQIAFVGDDVIDIPIMKKVVLGIAPSDAHQLVIDCANHITKSKGGDGVAREIAEFILSNTGLSLSEMYTGLFDDITQ
jgi:3-deoxy-D-manno-octulosonate 8-phosphate phosphatase (KDO 8-P phosphatase)